MKKGTTRKDVQDVLMEEGSRGRRMVDREAQTLHKQFQKDFEAIAKGGNVRNFKSFLTAHGLQEGSEQYRMAMKRWNAYQQEKRRAFSGDS